MKISINLSISTNKVPLGFDWDDLESIDQLGLTYLCFCHELVSWDGASEFRAQTQRYSGQLIFMLI